jgi:hypothetical protein
MLVFNVESVKSPEGLSYPSLVWLYRIHNEVEDCFGAFCFNPPLQAATIPCLVSRIGKLV